MTWRGQSNPEDRILACLPYLLPLIVSLSFGGFLFQQYPQLIFLFAIITPIAPLATGIPGLIIFFLLYMLVVRNTQLKHFLRFNTMQALLVDLGLNIISLVFGLLSGGLDFTDNSLTSFLISILFSTLFLGTIGIVTYSWYVIFQGKYPEIPVLSDAAYYHTQD